MGKRRLKGKWIAMAAVMAAVIFYAPEAEASEPVPQESKVIRVAFPETPGYSETGADGVRSGIFYDFLTEIAKYTGWRYEFIEGQTEELIDMLASGEVDMMGGMYLRDEYRDTFCYSDYNIGKIYSLILADKDDNRINFYDPRSLNGKKIGVLAAADSKIERLKSYLESNGINCGLVYYEDSEEYENCLKSGQTDMMLSSDIFRGNDYKPVGRFDGEYSYIAVSRKKEELTEPLNDAMRRIYMANGGFADDLYIKYFPYFHENTVVLDAEEKEYIEKLGAVRVAVVKDRYPFHYMYQGEERGIVTDVLSLISEQTGIHFTYVYGDNYDETIRLVTGGEAECTAHYMDSSEAAAGEGLITTKPFAALNEVIIKNRSVEQLTDGLTLVTLRGRTAPEYVKNQKVIYGDDLADCMNMVNDGEGDFSSIPSLVAEYMLRRRNFPDISFYMMNDMKSPMTFAVPQDGPTELYSVLSKAVNGITEEEVENIVMNNQLSPKEEKLSLTELIYRNPGLTVAVCIIVVSMLTAIILISLRSRMKNELMLGRLRQAEETSRAKSEFLSRMSHELRTPMNAIIGLTKLIRLTEKTTPEIDEKLEKIDTSSQYLLNLLNDILDMSKIESNKMSILAKPFLLDRIVNSLKIMMDMQAEERRIIFECRTTVKDKAYVGDELRIRQVLMNLLSNAFKYTPAGGRVTLSVQESDADGQAALLLFCVKDTGVGIEKKNFEKVFEAFEQVSDGEERIRGTGLGLSISSNMVRLMGGKLELTSEPGKGTEFFFTLKLPLAAADKIAAQREDEEDKDILTDDGLSGMRLLLAEDNELNAEITIALLEAKDIIVERAENGKEALQMFTGHPAGYYDAVLMDIQMPVMNGLTATQKIRESEKEDARSVPIIAMTANTFREDREQAMEAGMNDFIPKPFEIGELYRVFRKTVKRKDTGE